MSKDWYRDIDDFHKALGHHRSPCPCTPPPSVRDLRINLIREEITETLAALEASNLEALADGIADSIVVLLGTAVSYGIDMRPIWDEVHRTNMAKKGGPKRADGKTLKPKRWQPPRIKELLDEQRRR